MKALQECFENYAMVDLDAIAHNAEAIAKLVYPARLMAVLKGNAYGLGLEMVFKKLRKEGFEDFAIANLNEALFLKKLDAACAPLVFGNINPSRYELAQEAGIKWTIFSKEQWQLLREKIDKPITVHVKINTGFNRLGFDVCEESLDCIYEIYHHPMVTIEGIYSHLALLNEEEDKKAYRIFLSFVNELENRGIHIPIKHIADSISAVDYPWARLDMVRVGAALFGLRTARESYDALELKSAVQLYATVSQIRTLHKGEGVGYDLAFVAPKDMKIATIAIGYADGYPRSLSMGEGKVLIQGKLAPVLGIICMDQCMVDVTGIETVSINDPVLLYDVDRNSPVSLEKLSQQAGSNKNDIISGLSARVPRLYLDKGEIIR